MRVGIDLGVSNIDAVVEAPGERRFWRLPGNAAPTAETIQAVLAAGQVPLGAVVHLAVTGGRSRLFPDEVDGVPVRRVPEVEAIGRGGLVLSGLTSALVVSGGSGTAMCTARAERLVDGVPVGLETQHVGGTGVGGGTLLGLARLLLGTTSPAEIDALAQAGRSKAVDLTIGDVIGGSLSHLSPDATAVNFGRLAVGAEPPSREDLAAAIVTLVGQTIGLFMAKTAQAHGQTHVVVTGHLPDQPSMRRLLGRFGPFFGGEVVIPEHSGRATVLGAVTA